MTHKNPTSHPTEGNQNGLIARCETTPRSKGDYYEIRIKGHLEEHWSEWLGDLHISHEENGNSLLTGYILDQAALHGILARIHDLSLPLISLTYKALNTDKRKAKPREDR